MIINPLINEKAMKKFLYLLLLALVPAMTFTACGDDKDEVLDPKDPDNPGVTIKDASFKESGNKLILTYYVSGSSREGDIFTYEDEWTCEFNGEQLTRSSHVYSMPSSAIAKSVAAEIQENAEPGYSVSYSGSKVTYVDTPDLDDMSKTELRYIMKSMIGEK